MSSPSPMEPGTSHPLQSWKDSHLRLNFFASIDFPLEAFNKFIHCFFKRRAGTHDVQYRSEMRFFEVKSLRLKIDV